MKTRKRNEMDQYFQLYDDRISQSLCVNHQLMHMPQEQIQELCQTYGLSPVETYLEIRTIQTDHGEQNIKGFLRYLDAYLTEESAGKRTELQQLGESLLGRTLTSQNARTLRLEIIQGLLMNFASV